jgi:hypothetical protein
VSSQSKSPGYCVLLAPQRLHSFLNEVPLYHLFPEAESKEKQWFMEPYVGVNHNLTVCRLQSRLKHIYHGQPHARVDLNPILESTLTLCQSQLYPLVRDFQCGLWASCLHRCGQPDASWSRRSGSASWWATIPGSLAFRVKLTTARRLPAGK